MKSRSNSSTLEKNIDQILFLAKNSPSAHNSQPWKVRFDGSSFLVTVDANRKIESGDPVGRQTWISIGCFIETLALSILDVCSLRSDVSIEESLDGETYVRVEPTTKSTKKLTEVKKLILARHTNREFFKASKIEAKKIKTIANVSLEKNTTVATIEKRSDISDIAVLAYKATKIAFTNRRFREELSEFVISNNSRKEFGIPGYASNVSFLRSFIEPFAVKHGLTANSLADKEKRRLERSGALICICTKGDNINYWIAAGRSYMRVALQIEQLGLSQSTVASLVEAMDFHTEVEDLIETNYRLQSVIRIGYCSKETTPSPRADITLERIN